MLGARRRSRSSCHRCVVWDPCPHRGEAWQLGALSDEELASSSSVVDPDNNYVGAGHDGITPTRPW
ncbi:MAG: hypothetical protein R2789_11685 [Microthrixaceae bacterium]